MAKNDLVLLDGILEQRVSEGLPSTSLDEVFEFFAFEQLLKDYDLSREEIDSGWVDGRDDGGIDGFFTFVNGNLLRDPGDFAWPKRNADIDIWIISGKHHATFQQAPLNTLLASLPDLLDLRLENSQLLDRYAEPVLAARSRFHLAFRRLAVNRPTLTFHFVYVSRGDSSSVAANIRGRSNQLVALAKSMFSACQVRFHFAGASELVALHRRVKTFSLELPFVEHLVHGQQSYVVLANLMAFYRFVTDENGHLRRYLFDSNVRDYLRDTRVNEDIAASLRNTDGPEFWWLNNGVTILATGATVLGKTIQLQDVQIVNGLQTTETLFRHFATGAMESAERALLVRVVVSTDPTVRDLIIRATNNQSLVELASLHATDKIQRDIEEVLERHDWYYERRKNYYRNIGKPASRFVTPQFIAAGYVALVVKSPVVAAMLKPRKLRHPSSYAAVFPEDAPLRIWPIIVDVMKRVEEGLEEVRPRDASAGDRFLASWRNLVGLLVTARSLGRFSYSTDGLLALETGKIDRAWVGEMWGLVKQIEGFDRKKPFRKRAFVQTCCVEASERFGIADPDVVGRRRLPTLEGLEPVPHAGLIRKVEKLLPPEPWSPELHKTLAERLVCRPSIVLAAIRELARRRYVLRNGLEVRATADVAGDVRARDTQDRA